MSDTSTTAHAEGTKPKKKNMMMMMIVAVVVLAVGGGGAFFFLKRGQASETSEKDKKGSKEGKSKDKDEEEEEEAPEQAAEEKGKEGAAGKAKFSIKSLDLPDDKNVKQVLELQPFVVNLADKGEAHYLRMTVSVGIGETKEEKPDALLTTRIRNALLAVLIVKTTEEVLTEQGKVILRKQLLKAARAAVEEPTIEAIYITDFIVQL